MARRSYGQHCGLAVALDVVSQRWALLIVRDLTPGARRFSDLFAGLPGISTDMLTDRLRELESIGAVERVELTSPVPATVYQLTQSGRQLGRISGELAHWGASLLPPIAETSLRRNPRWAVQSFASRYTGGHQDATFHFLFDQRDEVTLSVDGRRATVRYGAVASDFTAELACTTDDFFVLLSGKVPCTGTNGGDIDGAEVQGDVAILQELMDTMKATLARTSN